MRSGGERPSALRRALVGALASWPLIARAQASGPRKRLAIFDVGSAEAIREKWAATLAELARRGWREGERLELLVRGPEPYAQGKPRPFDLLPQIARELVAQRPDCIVTAGTPITRVLANATREIPIVTHTADPLASGFVKSLAQPGGNVTGMSGGATEIALKSVELLKGIVPALRRIAILHLPERTFAEMGDFIESGAKTAGVESLRVPTTLPPDRVLAAIPGLRAQGVQAAFYASGTSEKHFADLARVAIRERLPVWSYSLDMVEAGLLGALTTDDDWEVAAGEVVDKVLRGARPGDIPVRLPTRFQLVINRATASALGLKLPPDIVMRVDRVIE